MTHHCHGCTNKIHRSGNPPIVSNLCHVCRRLWGVPPDQKVTLSPRQQQESIAGAKVVRTASMKKYY